MCCTIVEAACGHLKLSLLLRCLELGFVPLSFAPLAVLVLVHPAAAVYSTLDHANANDTEVIRGQLSYGNHVTQVSLCPHLCLRLRLTLSRRHSTAVLRCAQRCILAARAACWASGCGAMSCVTCW